MLLGALVLPSSRHLSESVETNRKMTIVFDTVNSLRRFTDWNALALRDPQADFELSGPASGVGAKLTWTSDVKQVGKGSWELIESVPDKSVKFAIEDQRRSEEHTSELQSLMRISYAVFCLKKKNKKERIREQIHRITSVH